MDWLEEDLENFEGVVGDLIGFGVPIALTVVAQKRVATGFLPKGSTLRTIYDAPGKYTQDLISKGGLQTFFGRTLRGAYEAQIASALVTKVMDSDSGNPNDNNRIRREKAVYQDLLWGAAFGTAGEYLGAAKNFIRDGKLPSVPFFTKANLANRYNQLTEAIADTIAHSLNFDLAV